MTTLRTTLNDFPLLSPEESLALCVSLLPAFVMIGRVTDSRLGHGSFGDVKLHRYVENGEERQVALKCYKLSLVDERCLREMLIHADLKHRNIIDFYGVFQQDNSQVGMALELASQTMDVFIRGKNKPKISLWERIKFLIDTANAIDYLHSVQLIHCDIKPENILITQNGTAKLSDFGFAMFQDETNKVNKAGTYDYMAPEFFQLDVPLSTAVDVYAYAITVIELISLKAAWTHFLHLPEKKRNGKIKAAVCVGERPSMHAIESLQLRQTVSAGLQQDPNKRCSISMFFEDLKRETHLRCDEKTVNDKKSSFIFSYCFC